VTPFEAEFSNSGWHIYVIKVKPGLLTVTRKEIFEALQAENIGVNVHYLPVYLHPYYRDLGYEKGICPNAEELYENMITLPLFPSMSNEDVNDVVVAVKKVIDYYRK
jgi:dTDP-4-amino-4,6-dideoxygalactose transaminase